MLQVALDNQTMDSAYETTRLIAEEVDIIEVGTILCDDAVHMAGHINNNPLVERLTVSAGAAAAGGKDQR